MNILYVGFKGRHNSSCQLVSRLPGERLLLTNSFSGLRREISGVSRLYDAVYLFGLDKSLCGSVRVETCAEEAGHILYTSADVFEQARKFTLLGIPCTISRQPSRYLCNAAYYALLEKMPCPVLLVHIPPLRNLPETMFAQLLAIFTNETLI